MSSSVLIVDDAVENVTILDETLGSEYEVLFALSGEQALETVARRPIDLILLDVHMPGLDGLEVCRRLKADPEFRDIPIIFLTSRSLAEDETRGLQMGAVDYITKPFNPAIVSARVQTHLELRRRQKAMVSFLQIASHDLRSPLSVISFCADLLEPELAKPINDAVLRAQSLIESYLEVSGPGQDSLAMHPENLELKDLVSEEIRFLVRAFPAAGVKIHNQVGNLTLQADREKLRQILSNLISNAIKYSPEGGNVCVNAIRIEGETRVSIRDQGLGFDASEQGRIFTQFARLGFSDLVPGTGLGLWLTRALVQAHGGRVWVKSAQGKGSEFIFTIPDLH